MKYLTTIFTTISFTLIILLSASCSKSFLEVNDSSTLNRQTYVTDLRTMEHFVNGLHVTISRDYLKDIGAAYADVVGDNMKPNLAKSPPSLEAHYYWSQVAEDNQELTVSRNSKAMNGEWKASYLDIRSCNFVIEDIGKYRKENERKADMLKGQAYAFRALMHFKLANIFAQNYQFSSNASHIGIPYITTSDITVPYSRESVFSNYDNIIKDLLEAIKLLPAEVTDIRQMNQLAAKAILSRVYLYMGDFNKAKSLALEITNKVPLLSIANGYPNAIFKNSPPAQSEVLFQLTPAYSTGNNPVNTVFLGNALKNQIFFASEGIANILTEDIQDVRSGWIKKTSGNWLIQKFPSGMAQIHPSAAHDFYPPVIRSSELFLTIAEASAQTNDENTARHYLNEVRMRANPAALPVTAVDVALLDSIYKERRKELAFEGTRMYDIQRWHQPVQRTDPSIPAAAQLPYPSKKAISPVPLMDVTIGRISQNEDY